MTPSGGRGSAEDRKDDGQGADGSTLRSTWIDRRGDGRLTVGPGESPVDRTRLGPSEPLWHELARLVHLTDAHVLDASSPARVPFLARLGPPVQSTFRPQETLTAQVLCGAINAVRAFAPDLVIEGGDLIDNAQHNELEQALALLNGGQVKPGSGADGYHGVQLSANPDPAYYRPDIDVPRHPGLLQAAVRPFTSTGLGRGWIPVLGDHDALLAGELVPSPVTQSLAVGDRALWEMPMNLRLPSDMQLSASGSPGGLPDGDLVSSLVEQALAGSTVPVPPDHRRRELTFSEVTQRLWAGCRDGAQTHPRPAAAPAPGERLDYVSDVGESLRVIVLDVVRRKGGSGGLVATGQPAWLREQLACAGQRWVIVVTHQPLENTAGSERLMALLDGSPRVIAALAGHTHRNRIVPRETAAGGYWLITTCSLVDFPQQCRALTLYDTEGGGVALQTWMLDHVGHGSLGSISRELSLRDVGARSVHHTGTRWDRNATLFRRPVA